MGIRIFISRLDVHFIISYARKLIYQNIIIIEVSKTIRGIRHCHRTKMKYK